MRYINLHFTLLYFTVIYTYTHGQFLTMSVGLGLGVVFVDLFRFGILCIFSLGILFLCCLFLLC